MGEFRVAQVLVNKEFSVEVLPGFEEGSRTVQ
jgi:hypothetical protein